MQRPASAPNLALWRGQGRRLLRDHPAGALNSKPQQCRQSNLILRDIQPDGICGQIRLADDVRRDTLVSVQNALGSRHPGRVFDHRLRRGRREHAWREPSQVGGVEVDVLMLGGDDAGLVDEVTAQMTYDERELREVGGHLVNGWG